MKALLLAAGILVLTGCSGGLKSDAAPDQVYVLRVAAAAEAANTESVAVGTVQVPRPWAFPGLESERIILVQSDHRMSHFAASRWADDLPEIVEALALETLRTSPAWSSVFDSRVPYAADYSLQLTIRRFEADYSQNASKPVIHVSFACTLGRHSDRSVVASFDVDSSVTAAENRIGVIVSAFEQAANTALRSVAMRSVDEIRKSKGPSTP